MKTDKEINPSFPGELRKKFVEGIRNDSGVPHYVGDGLEQCQVCLTMKKPHACKRCLDSEIKKARESVIDEVKEWGEVAKLSKDEKLIGAYEFLISKLEKAESGDDRHE